MTKEEQLIRDIEDYSRSPSLNKYIVDRAKRELQKLREKKENLEEKITPVNIKVSILKPNITKKKVKSKKSKK